MPCPWKIGIKRRIAQRTGSRLNTSEPVYDEIVGRHNSPPRRGGVARQLNISWRAGVVSSALLFGRSSVEASPYRACASRHPVCAVAWLGASAPPLRGGA